MREISIEDYRGIPFLLYDDKASKKITIDGIKYLEEIRKGFYKKSFNNQEFLPPIKKKRDINLIFV